MISFSILSILTLTISIFAHEQEVHGEQSLLRYTKKQITKQQLLDHLKNRIPHYSVTQNNIHQNFYVCSYKILGYYYNIIAVITIDNDKYTIKIYYPTYKKVKKALSSSKYRICDTNYFLYS